VFLIKENKKRIREEKKITAKEAWDLVVGKVNASSEIDACLMSEDSAVQWISVGTFNVNKAFEKIAKLCSSKAKGFQIVFSASDIREGILYEWGGGKRKTTIKLYLKDKTILSLDC